MTSARSKVRVVKMNTAGGMDWQAKRLEGKIFTVRYIDSAGQIHFEETGIALFPGVDEYEIVKKRYWRKGTSPFSFRLIDLKFNTPSPAKSPAAGS